MISTNNAMNYTENVIVKYDANRIEEPSVLIMLVLWCNKRIEVISHVAASLINNKL